MDPNSPRNKDRGFRKLLLSQFAGQSHRLEGWHKAVQSLAPGVSRTTVGSTIANLCRDGLAQGNGKLHARNQIWTIVASKKPAKQPRPAPNPQPSPYLNGGGGAMIAISLGEKRTELVEPKIARRILEDLQVLFS